MVKKTDIYITFLSAIILGLIFLFTSCGSLEDNSSNSNQRSSNANSTISETKKANDNIEELMNIIRLPEIPAEVVWKEEKQGTASNRVPGPTDQKLTVVFRYTDTEEDKAKTKLLALLEKNTNNGAAEIPAEDWFPEELVAQAQLSGNESVKGISYGASDFTNMPYGNGRIVHITNTDYFVLELYAN